MVGSWDGLEKGCYQFMNNVAINIIIIIMIIMVIIIIIIFFSFAGDYSGRPVVVMYEAALRRSPMVPYSLLCITAAQGGEVQAEISCACAGSVCCGLFAAGRWLPAPFGSADGSPVSALEFGCKLC